MPCADDDDLVGGDPDLEGRATPEEPFAAVDMTCYVPIIFDRPGAL